MPSPDSNEESRANRRVLRLAIAATLAVPAVLFLAGDMIEAPRATWQRVLAGLVAGAGVLFLAFFRARSRPAKAGLVLLLLLAVSPYLLALCVRWGYDTAERGMRRIPPDELAATPSVLLVTTDAASDHALRFPRERWVVLDGVVAASPRRDPALASLLTGRPVLVHRVLDAGEGLDPRIEPIGQSLVAAGFDARGYGITALPQWAGRELEAAVGGVAHAARWVAARGDAPRFAHVHVDRVDPVRIDAATREIGTDDVVVVASILGAADPGAEPGPFLDPSALETLVAVRSGPDAFAFIEERSRSACEVHTSIARAVERGRGFWWPLTGADEPALGDTLPLDEVLVVSMAHGVDGRPHRIRAAFADVVLDVSATPLGEHPTDDWALRGPTRGHVAYRNSVRVMPVERTGDVDGLIEALSDWRRHYGWNEWQRDDPAPR
ncbi:MAG: hypothetical protein AAGB93_21450 [Planctomycetota bacterium]